MFCYVNHGAARNLGFVTSSEYIIVNDAVSESYRGVAVYDRFVTSSEYVEGIIVKTVGTLLSVSSYINLDITRYARCIAAAEYAACLGR